MHLSFKSHKVIFIEINLVFIFKKTKVFKLFFLKPIRNVLTNTQKNVYL